MANTLSNPNRINDYSLAPSFAKGIPEDIFFIDSKTREMIEMGMPEATALKDSIILSNTFTTQEEKHDILTSILANSASDGSLTPNLELSSCPEGCYSILDAYPKPKSIYKWFHVAIPPLGPKAFPGLSIGRELAHNLYHSKRFLEELYEAETLVEMAYLSATELMNFLSDLVGMEAQIREISSAKLDHDRYVTINKHLIGMLSPMQTYLDRLYDVNAKPINRESKKWHYLDDGIKYSKSKTLISLIKKARKELTAIWNIAKHEQNLIHEIYPRIISRFKTEEVRQTISIAAATSEDIMETLCEIWSKFLRVRHFILSTTYDLSMQHRNQILDFGLQYIEYLPDDEAQILFSGDTPTNMTLYWADSEIAPLFYYPLDLDYDDIRIDIAAKYTDNPIDTTKLTKDLSTLISSSVSEAEEDFNNQEFASRYVEIMKLQQIPRETSRGEPMIPARLLR